MLASGAINAEVNFWVDSFCLIVSQWGFPCCFACCIFRFHAAESPKKALSTQLLYVGKMVPIPYALFSVLAHYKNCRVSTRSFARNEFSERCVIWQDQQGNVA